MRHDRSWWLVVPLMATLAACSGVEGPPTIVTEGDSADNVMFGISHTVMTDGVRRVRIDADTAYYYESRQTAELHQLTVIFFSPAGGETSRITADWGTYEYRSQDMIARHNVVGITPDGRRLTTEELRYDRVEDRLETDEPFVFDSPEEHLEGSGFSADRNFRDVRASNIRAEVRN
jgi:LPS export ABC transporter protein LptC